ncbi:MAG TPA: response regulator [Qipengyuania sp.]|nr:response regulator [Qipengyuania sp.]
MQQRLLHFAARRPAATAAVLSAIVASVVAAMLISACGPSTSAIVAAGLAGAVVATLAGALFGSLLRRQTASVDAGAARLAELAGHCGQGEAADNSVPRVKFDPARFEQDITAVRRAYRSLEREREQSQNALEQQIARQSEFYAKLSHELRSPLNAILGYASLAIEDAEAGQLDDLPRDLRKIRGAGQNLLGLIDNLLQLAEDRTGRETAERVPFLLRDVLAQVISEHGEAAGAGPLLAMQEGAGRETLFGNSAKVARAIASLVDDAIRGRSATLITLSTRTSTTHDACVEVLVDARKGASQSAESSETLTRHLAERLAAAVAGSLDVEQPGAGEWRYVLRLPLDIDGAPGRPAIRTVSLAQLPPVEPGAARKSALVIDDDAATIDLMSRWLERSGYDVRAATNAEHGLTIAQSMAPDIVLLDALMPGRTGYDVLPDLTALPALRDTPILIVTVDDDRGRGLAAGASDYVRKPITETRLREIISVYEKDLDGEVLIIEDDQDSAEMLERMVRRLGFSIRRAADGVEGLAALGDSRPVAILLDLNMPNLNGFEFIEQLAQSENYATIPLIVLSGQELSVAQHHRLLAAGCRYYMKGSAAPREIAATLREMVA